MTGINLEFRNLTKGHQLNMVHDALVEGGSLNKLSDSDKEYFYSGLGELKLRRKLFFGTVYTVLLTYDKENDKIIASCDSY